VDGDTNLSVRERGRFIFWKKAEAFQLCEERYSGFQVNYGGNFLDEKRQMGKPGKGKT